MDRNTALTLVLALVAVAAISFAAATLDSAQSTGSGIGGGSGPGPGLSGHSGNFSMTGNATHNGTGGAARTSLCVASLSRGPVKLAIVAVFALLVGIVYWRTRSALASATFSFVFGIPVLLVYELLTSCNRDLSQRSQPMGPISSPNQSVFGGGGALGSGNTGQVASTPTLLLGALLVIALVGAGLMLFYSTGNDEETVEETVDDPTPTTDVAAIGRAAGEAADRIEADADVENEVFRAWREMTQYVDVPRPESSTPGEFAAAAVDAGMARGDVQALTDLFEDVRYGGKEATTDRERRAVEALRQIEATYADDADADDGGDGGERQ